MKNQGLYRNKLSQLRTLLKKAASSREYTASETAKLNALAKLSSRDFIRDTINPEIEGLKLKNKLLGNNLYAQVCEKLREIEQLTEVENTALDLTRPDWSNALRLIEMAGNNISADLVRQINASFSGDMPALKALQQVYKAKGVKYDGGLSEQIITPGRQFDYLRDFAFSSLVQNISLNSLAVAINKVTKLEGVEFPPITQDDVALIAARRAAGLPEQSQTSEE